MRRCGLSGSVSELMAMTGEPEDFAPEHLQLLKAFLHERRETVGAVGAVATRISSPPAAQLRPVIGEVGLFVWTRHGKTQLVSASAAAGAYVIPDSEHLADVCALRASLAELGLSGVALDAAAQKYETLRSAGHTPVSAFDDVFCDTLSTRMPMSADLLRLATLVPRAQVAIYSRISLLWTEGNIGWESTLNRDEQRVIVRAMLKTQRHAPANERNFATIAPLLALRRMDSARDGAASSLLGLAGDHGISLPRARLLHALDLQP